MVRILFVTHGPLLYGAQQSLLALMEGLDRAEFFPILLSPREGPLTNEARRLGIPVELAPIEHWVAFDPAAQRGYFIRLFRLLRGLYRRAKCIAEIARRAQADLVYTNTVTVLEGALGARLAGKPHIWHLREHVAGNPDLKPVLPAGWISCLIARLSDSIIFNSESLRKAYGDVFHTARTLIVHNGISAINSSDCARESFRQELGLAPDARIVCTIGSITPRKGLPIFIRAASALVKIVPNIFFVVVGDGQPAYAASLQEQVAAAGLKDVFRFAGWSNDIPRVLSAIDLLLVTAEQEAFGRTVIEAMSAKVPVVSTRCGGPEEIIEDGESGFLVPVGDPDRLAAAAARILSEPELAEAFATAAYLRVQEKFSMAAYVHGVQSAIQSTTG